MTHVSLYSVQPEGQSELLCWKLQITADQDSQIAAQGYYTQSLYAGDTLDEVEAMLKEALRQVDERKQQS